MEAQMMLLSDLLPRYWGLRVPILFALAVTGPLFLTLLITSWSARRAVAVAKRTAPGLKRPPTLPYVIPFVGHVFQFMRDGHRFMSSTA